ncbi:SLBB domain-containing protein [Mariprofundus ferrinatatus]|uniref:SLBB domain-containing protein n=1 Tax=Mariprofundus ferrinatatus TaxID=1921087 RepID=UPI0018E257D9|nr:SLBB domain-containing protein [Mariprofundus ferrinatatus]
MFSLLLLVMAVAPAFAITLTPDQIQKIQQLSPAEREALAKQAGVSSPEASARSIESPQTVQPRPVSSGPLEGEMTGATSDASQQAQEVAKSAGVDVPVEKVAGTAGADALEVRRAFADFVSESKPLTVNAGNLKQFGYDLFAGSPTTFAPATDVPVPPEYVVGPGDELVVQLFGGKNDQFTLVVDREGVVAFPEVGPVMLAGMSFADAKATLAQQVGEKMIGVTASINMGKLRSIRIFALGEVEQPGSYVVSGLATLSHALLVSGGVKKIGSLRNIQLKRGGQVVAAIDLYDFLLRGDTSGDVRLLPGDVVFVPPIGITVGIAGEVVRPAIYEVGRRTDVSDMIKLAGGFLPKAYRDKALIERINPSGDKSVVGLSLKGKSPNKTQVRNGDIIKVFSALDYEDNPVLLIGNVKRPGKYAWTKGMSLSALLPDQDMLLPETFMDYGLIEREAEGNREPEVIRFKVSELFMKGSEQVDLYLMPRDKVYVFHRAHFREAPQASIAGSVKSPGQYELKKSMRILDLILAAGGTIRSSSFDDAELYRTDPETKEVSISRFSLAAALDGQADANILLQDMDKVVVHSVWEDKQRHTVRIHGEVNNPGEFLFADSEMRVSDLIFAAGSVTEQAYMHKAEITRYEVIDGEKRQTSHLSIDLRDALQGKEQANILLQPYDVLMVRTISNWRSHEQVTLKGEFRFPGTYTVEEGETLEQVIERAGGLTEDAFTQAAVFSRESIRAQQQVNLNESISRLEKDIAQAEITNSTISNREVLDDKQKGLIAAERALAKLREVKPTGRLLVELGSDGKLIGDSTLKLTDGDVLYVPKRPDQVLVMGEVYNQNAMLYRKGMDRDDFIDLAGGTTAMADTDRIYIVRANGYVESGSGWSSNHKIYPGDTIIVPQRLDVFNLLDTTLDWSKVLMQIGIFTASMVTVGIL